MPNSASGPHSAMRLAQTLRVNAPIAAVIILLIALVWIATLERIGYERADAISDTERNNTNLTLALEEHTVRTLKSVHQMLADLALEYRDEGRKLDLKDLVREGVVDDHLYHFIGVVDERGNVVLGSGAFPQTYLGDRKFFLVHREKESRDMFIDKPLEGRITGNWVIPMSRRVSKRDGSFGGVVFAGVDPDYFESFYQRADLGKDGFVMLIGLDGISRVRRVGSASSFGQDMRDSTLFAEQEKAPYGSFLSTGKLDGTRRFTSYRTLAQYPVVVAVGTSVKEVLAELNSRQRAYYTAALLASIFILLTGAGSVFLFERHRKAKEATGRSDARFRATFNQSAVAIVLSTPDGQILDANDAFCKGIGYTRSELNDLTFHDIVHPEDVATIIEDRRMVESGEVESSTRDVRFVKKGGSVGWATRSTSAVRGEDRSVDYFVSMYRDITEHKRDQHNLQIKNTVLVTQQETSLDAILVVDENSTIISYNRQFIDLWGIPEQMVAAGNDEPVLQAVVDQMRDPEGFLAKVKHLYEHREEKSFDEVLTKGGKIVDRYSAPVIAGNGEYHGRVWYFRDITARRRAVEDLAESQERFRQVAESIRDVFFLIDADSNRVHYVNPAYEEIWGRSRESLYEQPRSWADAIHPEDRALALEKFTEGMKTGAFDYEYRIVRPDGAVRWIHVRGFPIRNDTGKVYRTAGIAQDVTKAREMQERLVHQAHYDALTGLPNRTLCFDRLQQILSWARRRNSIAGFLFVDLDRFKNVNDTLGHLAGDELLRQVAARLSGCVRTEDTVARLGGDEFGVILSDFAKADDMAVVAKKVIEALAKPFDLDGYEAYVTASVGIACFPRDSENPEALIKNADAAMFRAKLVGRNNYQFYTTEMNERALEKLNRENQLRRALEREEFLLYFQPKVDLNTRRTTSCEALLRWNLPGNELVPPNDFIPLLEDSGLIVPVGEWVLGAACAQVRAWQDAGIVPVPVAVNLSARQFQRADICATVAKALEAHGVDPRFLELEITETAAMQGAEETVATLLKLKAIGVRLSIDDFGTGYSSLSYLKRFPVDALKIDRSFVTGLPDEPDDVSIARAIIGMAHSLHLKVIAEGVETEEQRRFLAANDCDEMQGYLVAKPMPADEFTRLIGERRRQSGTDANECEFSLVA
jgi:diguanylate cyclase (GGDEF)-like protein/PAS domain S-box-containing protein